MSQYAGLVVGAILAVQQVIPIFEPRPPVELTSWHCIENAKITGYNRVDPAMNATTADGTPITTPEPIAAASYNIPMGARVNVEGIGTFRVADRGHLSPTHIDIAVWSNQEAYQITSRRTVCIEQR